MVGHLDRVSIAIRMIGEQDRLTTMSDANHSNTVHEHRQASRLSQAELANMCGVSRQTIASVERGYSVPSVYVATALAKALGTTVAALFEYPSRPR